MSPRFKNREDLIWSEKASVPHSSDISSVETLSIVYVRGMAGMGEHYSKIALKSFVSILLGIHIFYLRKGLSKGLKSQTNKF